MKNPLVWMQNGSVVARCELIRGPIRETVHDLLHRHPVLLRWVGNSGALDAAAAQLGASIRSRFEIEVEPIDLD